MDQCTVILRNRTSTESQDSEKEYVIKALNGKGETNAMRYLESMLKQLLSGITTAQERRGRKDLEESEKYIKSLEDQIERLQQQPQETVRDTSGLTDEEIISLR